MTSTGPTHVRAIVKGVTTSLNPRHHAAVGTVFQLTLDGLLERVTNSRAGLSSEEALRRFDSNGPNEFQTTRLRSEIVDNIRGSANPLVIILLIAGLASSQPKNVSSCPLRA